MIDVINVQNFDDATITCYPYRTARVVNHQLIEEYDRSPETDDFDDLQRRLAEAAGEQPDNHTVYKIERSDRDIVYIMFSDLRVRVGRDALIGHW